MLNVKHEIGMCCNISPLQRQKEILLAANDVHQFSQTPTERDRQYAPGSLVINILHLYSLRAVKDQKICECQIGVGVLRESRLLAPFDPDVVARGRFSSPGQGCYRLGPVGKGKAM